MTGYSKKDDIRVRKTNQALVNSMFTMLNSQRFGKISVNELCEIALISRATFYSHFVDKYSLLKYFLGRLLHDNIFACEGNELIPLVNTFIANHEKILKNLLEGADETTLELLHDFFESLFKIAFGFADSPPCFMLSAFYTGGIVNLLKWQVKNKFPPDKQLMNVDLFKVLSFIMELDHNNEHSEQ